MNRSEDYESFPLYFDSVGIVAGTTKKKSGMGMYSFAPVTMYASYIYRPLVERTEPKNPYALARRKTWMGPAGVKKFGMSGNFLRTVERVFLLFVDYKISQWIHL